MAMIVADGGTVILTGISVMDHRHLESGLSPVWLEGAAVGLQ